MSVVRGSFVLILLFGTMALGQTPASRENKAPTDRAVDFKSGELDKIRDEMVVRKVITDRIVEGVTHSVNVRHIRGSETGLVHGKITEVWVVRDGSGTVATGGELVDAKAGAAPGDFSGSSIRGGVERVISAGDIVFIPPGVPHGIKETKSITYLNIRFETR